jgi:uncharacterized protein YndB with AHSA1/START domain
VKRVVLEGRVGGRIYEELADARRYQWGKVTAWEPPSRVAFTWHPSREETAAQDVVVTFTADGDQTRVDLVSTGWERLGAKAKGARKGYDIGWGSVLDAYAGRRSAALIIFALVVGVVTLYLKATGKLERSIDEAKGRIPADSI